MNPYILSRRLFAIVKYIQNLFALAEQILASQIYAFQMARVLIKMSIIFMCVSGLLLKQYFSYMRAYYLILLAFGTWKVCTEVGFFNKTCWF